MKRMCVLLLSVLFVWPARGQNPQDQRHFGPVHMGQDASALPFPCEGLVICEGQVGTAWVRVNLTEAKKVAIITVIYNDKKMTGEWVVNHTVTLPFALRDHSYANNKEPLQLAFAEVDGHIQGTLDLKNSIFYMENPEDKAKGIIDVVYLQPDAPILAKAVRRPMLDKLAAAYDLMMKSPKFAALSEKDQ